MSYYWGYGWGAMTWDKVKSEAELYELERKADEEYSEFESMMERMKNAPKRKSVIIVEYEIEKD